jgi:hypothetical protein
MGLINPMRGYGIRVNDFDTSRVFGIDSDHAFYPFNTTRTVVHYESRVPTEWLGEDAPTNYNTRERGLESISRGRVA